MRLTESSSVRRLRWAGAGRRLMIAAVLSTVGPVVPGQGNPSSVDLLIAEDESVFILFNRGNGTFLWESGYGSEEGVDGVAVGDFDGDGDLDFANNSGLYLGRGDFRFTFLEFLPEDARRCRDQWRKSRLPPRTRKCCGVQPGCHGN